jgi:ribonuclease D
MQSSDELKIALSAADSAVLLQNPVDIQRASKAWRRSPVLGLDTEFVRERTYFANIGLVQISDGQTVWLVDPLKPGAMEPIAELLSDKRITKLFHSPSEDLEVLLHAANALPEPLIDTQAACALLGQPLQMGYHAAVEWMFGISLKKEQTRSNWCARPLKPEQLLYAAQDVCLLPGMWRRLEKQLDDAGRLEWLVEDCEQQLQRARYATPPEDNWQRIRGIGRLDGQSLAVLQALADWREREARERNRPRGFIIKDNVLVAIADRKLTDPAALSEFEELHPRAAQRHGEVVCHIVEQTLGSGKRLNPIDRLSNAQKRALDQLRKRTQKRAVELELESVVLASKRELEQIVRSYPETSLPDRLLGWRQSALVESLLADLSETMK